MNPRTKAKLERRIKETVAQVILRDLVDPRLGFITVIAVELSPEMDGAKVMVSVLGNEAARKKSLAALNDGSGFMQEAVARALATRRTPRLEFLFDPSIETADRVARVIREARREDDEAAAARGELPVAPAESADDEDDESDEADEPTSD